MCGVKRVHNKAKHNSPPYLVFTRDSTAALTAQLNPPYLPAETSAETAHHIVTLNPPSLHRLLTSLPPNTRHPELSEASPIAARVSD